MWLRGNALLCASVIAICWAASWSIARGDDEDAAAKADVTREVLQWFLEGKDEVFLAACTETVRQALEGGKLAEARKGLLDSLGAYEREVDAKRTESSRYTIVDLTSNFAHGSVKVRVVFENGSIAGFRFMPADADGGYEPPAYADPSKFTEHTVVVKCGPVELPGTVSVPIGGGRYPGVVLVHGSGPHDRDETLNGNKPFKDLAWGLASRGIAVLRYEKRTKHYAVTIDPASVTIDEETVDDAVAAARLLMKEKSVDPKRVFVVGHSLGATAAPYIGTKEPKLAGVILLAAAARPIHELVAEQLPYIFGLDGKVDDAEKKQMDEANKAIAALRAGKWAPEDKLLGTPLAYWALLAKLEPVETAGRLKMRVLIAQGGRDYQVSADRDFGLFKKHLAGVDHVTLKLFDKMDHLFRAGEGPSTPQSYSVPGHVAQEVVDYLAGWISAVK